MHHLRKTFLFVALALSNGCSKSPAADAPAPEISQPPPAPESVIPPDAEKSDSGLISKVLEPGSGEQRPEPHDKVRVNFVARNEKGEIKDSSEKRGGPVIYDVTGVIAGWTEALKEMRVGEKRRLWIPDELVYPGRAGYPRPMSVFDLELLEIIDGEPPHPAPEDVSAAPPEATKTRSGLAYRMLRKGRSNERPRAWDRVSIHYAGWTADGAAIESSRRELASTFDVGSVMPGWREGLQLLAVGDKGRFWIPEELAYQGRAGEPRGMVVFDLELVSIERRPEPPRAPKHLTAPPPAAKRTKSGLAYQIVQRGRGKRKPTADDRVEVHYSAWTSDGNLFDSSITRGTASTVPVGRLIPGWSEGLQLMVEGDKALLWIPEALAYAGREGAPKGMLVYQVELLKIEE